MNKNFIWDRQKLSQALGSHDIPEFESNYIVIDSRKVSNGNIFIGLVGSRFDGGVFAKKALENGAAVCIVNKSLGINHPKIIAVEDTEQALFVMASFRRVNFSKNTKIIGVTGSAGKTSTKESVKLVLQGFGNVYATTGNLNNHLGLPLTIANAPHDIDYCVLEMGMNHSGEIAYLSKIAKPDVAIITTVAPAHLEFFDSVENIAKAKAEIYQGMETGGWVIINEDSVYKNILLEEAKKYQLNILTFGENQHADIRLVEYKIVHNKTMIKAQYADEQINYFFPVIAGKHFALNSLAVIATSIVLGCDINKVLNMLALFKPIYGRGAAQLLKNNIILIDDAYNANPASVMSVLESVINYKTNGNRLIAILGDMRELGSSAQELHVGLLEQSLKMDLIYTVGDLMKNLFDSLPQEKRGIHANNAEEMSNFIINQIKENDIILVKGSFSMQMSKIVNLISQHFAQ